MPGSIRFCLALAVALACTAGCRAEEAGGAALLRKCAAYLDGANGRRLPVDAARDAASCPAFIDATIAAGRLAHERRGLLLPNGAPPGPVDAKAYRAFATSLRLGSDVCLPGGLATWDVARQFRLIMSLNRELLWADELTSLRFVLAELYPCNGASP